MRLHKALISSALIALAIWALSTRALGQAASPQEGAARTVCANTLRTLVDAIVREGGTRDEATQYPELVLASYATRGPDRDQIVSFVSGEVRAGGVTARRRAELEAAACVAVVGTAFDAGMADVGELRSYWDARRKALLPPPETSPAVDCVTSDYGTSKRGEPALLRNKCDYAVTTGYCVQSVAAGSKSEELSCEKGLYTIYEIKPRHAAMVVLTDGDRLRWLACRPPFRPRLWWVSSDATNPAMGACEK